MTQFPARFRIAVLLIAAGGVAVPGSLALAESPAAFLAQAEAAAAGNDSTAAVRLASQAIEADDKLAAAFYLRGREQFRLGLVAESVSDFDRYIELQPATASRQWERGIACYYAKQFEKGAKQFELYQSFHDNDVENSVWRYLCMVPTEGIEKARATILPIRNDRRVPMMQVYELYRGNLKPDEVLAACRRDDPDPEKLASRLFYAHLYLGLYHEVASEKELAQNYILLAADKKLADNPRINRYMWDVARIHAEVMKKTPK
jgi:lipoprotein NlpI